MDNHFYFIVLIIIGIVIWQFIIFGKTVGLLKKFKSIFNDDGKNYGLISEDIINSIENITNEDVLIDLLKKTDIDFHKYYSATYSITESKFVNSFNIEIAKQDLVNHYKNHKGFRAKNDNPVYRQIENSINSYLEKNRNGVSDFSLMKDIVDRNCDAVEEEINTQIPIPLYLGLVGTMMGILIGIGYLWISGGLSDLLNTTNSDLLNSNAVSTSSAGVEALLGGVALAMISSIFGILLTTSGSIRAKNIKSKVEKNKHIFLSWIQRELLPSLNSDVSGALIEMSRNLQEFNTTFSSNTNDLDKALSQINENTRLQTELLNAVKQAETRELSSQMISNLDALRTSAKEIGTLSEYLNNCNQYLDNVKALNNKLDKAQERTKAIEEMGAFFRQEIEHIEQRGYAMANDVTRVNDYLQRALDRLMESTQKQLTDFNNIFTKQSDVLQQKSQEIERLVTELKQLTAIKDSISKFEKTMSAQNSKLDTLANAIQALAKAKVEGTNVPVFTNPGMKMWKKILIWIGSILGGLTLLSLLIANWDSIYVFLSDIFKI